MTDVLIIGAGPSGSMSAALLASKGYDVVRIPMPVPHCTIGSNCRPDYERDLSSDTLRQAPTSPK